MSKGYWSTSSNLLANYLNNLQGDFKLSFQASSWVIIFHHHKKINSTIYMTLIMGIVLYLHALI